MDSRALIIAEAGVNHNGDRARALDLVKAAKRAGADVVKFQSFRAEKLATASASKANYQQVTTGSEQSQLDMLRGLQLTEDDEEVVAAACAAAGIEYLSTPFDPDSATNLVRRVGMRRIKIGSGDLTNAPLLLHVARFNLPIILSTGMATLSEVERALGVIAYGYLRGAAAQPSLADFSEILLDRKTWTELRKKVTLLHCTTEYPAEAQSINLRAMATLTNAFDLPVGFSDHSRGIHIASAAAALGASVIEKHLTLDRNLPGPDHRASIEPDEFAAMVQSIRDVELALGDGRKVPAPEELANRNIARRSLVAARAIARGEKFTPDNIAVKRPGTGMAPEHYWDLLGQVADRAYAEDESVGRVI
ncbi:N-acetylneuraminate synthase [Bradyrhizobium guangdongense]|uniref:N-acetylneuraminate synthase n=1 Tax=Bradyrhizobium guangdongense TaxID=1325090 RepID=UPI00112905AE|nr:N-acetylneuraminate synthase [Bradyrhizobium guangdongense]TPQ35487.1 N-acetylneuraminate synthase [Bradyrhizobium guangdongense]